MEHTKTIETRNLCDSAKNGGCGSGTEYMEVTPWGDLYPCHQFVGDEKYLLGAAVLLRRMRRQRLPRRRLRHGRL